MSSPSPQRPQTRDAGAAMSIAAARPQWPQNWTSSRAVGVAGKRDELRASDHALPSCAAASGVGSSCARTGASRARPSSRSRIWRCASPGDSASWRAGGPRRARRVPRRNSVIGARRRSDAHAVGPARDLVVGRLGARRRRRPAARTRASTSTRPATPVTGSTSTRAPERTLKSWSARSASASGSRSSRVASPMRTAAGRIGGGARRCARCSQSVGPAGREGPRRAVEAVALAELVDRRQQHLLDRALDGAQREGGLHGGVGAIELEGLQRADEDARVRSSATRARGRSPTRSTGPPGARREARPPPRACRGGACPPCAAASGSRNDAPTRGACWG